MCVKLIQTVVLEEHAFKKYVELMMKMNAHLILSVIQTQNAEIANVFQNVEDPLTVNLMKYVIDSNVFQGNAQLTYNVDQETFVVDNDVYFSVKTMEIVLEKEKFV